MTEKTPLNFSEYRPYKEMGKSCQLKDMADFQIHWPELTAASRLTNRDLILRYMSGKDIDQVVALWKHVYPEAFGSAHQFIFDPQWYEDHVLLHENWQADAGEKKYAVILFENLEERQLMGILLMTKSDQNLQVELTLGGLHPAFRRKKAFFPLFREILDAVSTTEVELITAFAETWHTKTQELMDHNGFKIWGVFPGSMVRWSHDQKCYRACEVHYYKFVNRGERYATRPAEWALSEKSKKLWQVLEELNG
jgi:RimJ/RimL family protein N-acetyltransferase